MQITQKNYISNLPPELFEKVFNNLDERSIHEIGFTDTKIHQSVFGALIFKLKIPTNSTSSVYSQVIEHYKTHCKYFLQVLPKSFPDFNKYSTVIDTKMYVDNILSKAQDPDKEREYIFGGSTLEVAWDYFIEKTLPLIDYDLLHEIDSITELSKDLEQEMKKNGGKINFDIFSKFRQAFP